RLVDHIRTVLGEGIAFEELAMHRTTLCLAALILGVLAALPDGAQGQGKKKIEQATAGDYSYLANQKSVSGQLISFNDSAKTITVRIDFPEWVPNPNFKQN